MGLPAANGDAVTPSFTVGTRPRPNQLPRLAVTSDLLRFDACPLRYRLHAVAGWPEADADEAFRLAGVLVHAALDHAGTSCRPVSAGGEGLPFDEGIVERGIAFARRAVDTRSPRETRPQTHKDTLDGAEAVARRAIQDLGPELFPILAATEEQLSSTRRHPAALLPGRVRRVERFEVVGILDAVMAPVHSSADASGGLTGLVAAAAREVHHSAGPVTAIIDYKAGRRSAHAPHTLGAGAVETDDHAFQIACYAAIRARFRDFPVQIGLIIYLEDLLDNVSTLPLDRRLARATTVVHLDGPARLAAETRIDGIALEIDACVEREASSLTLRSAWPARTSRLCTRCDLRPMCPAWQGPDSQGGGSFPIGSGQDPLAGDPIEI